MYAVIKTGGKQYRVKEGDVVEVEHLAAREEEVTLTPVLVVTDDGKTVYGAAELRSYPVVARLLGEAKGDKVTVFKYRRKTGYAVKTGHRQLYSMIEIVSIGRKDGEGQAAEAPSEAPAEPEAAPAEE